MKKLAVVFGLAFMMACSGGNEFRKFSDALPKVQTPVRFNNSGIIQQAESRVSIPAEFKKYAPQGADLVLGKFYEDDKTTGIVFLRSGDVSAPVLMTYSGSGVKLDSIDLFTYDDALQGADVKRLVTFLPDRKILSIDSVLIWTEVYTADNPDITEATRMQQLSMDTVLRTIDVNGKITKE